MSLDQDQQALARRIESGEITNVMTLLTADYGSPTDARAMPITIWQSPESVGEPVWFRNASELYDVAVLFDTTVQYLSTNQFLTLYPIARNAQVMHQSEMAADKDNRGPRSAPLVMKAFELVYLRSQEEIAVLPAFHELVARGFKTRDELASEESARRFERTEARAARAEFFTRVIAVGSLVVSAAVAIGTTWYNAETYDRNRNVVIVDRRDSVADTSFVRIVGPSNALCDSVRRDSASAPKSVAR